MNAVPGSDAFASAMVDMDWQFNQHTYDGTVRVPYTLGPDGKFPWHSRERGTTKEMRRHANYYGGMAFWGKFQRAAGKISAEGRPARLCRRKLVDKLFGHCEYQLELAAQSGKVGIAELLVPEALRTPQAAQYALQRGFERVSALIASAIPAAEPVRGVADDPPLVRWPRGFDL